MPNRGVPRKGWGLKARGRRARLPPMATSYGTQYEERGGLLTRVVDRTRCVHANVTWHGRALTTLEVPGAIVRGEVIEDALLGSAHAIDRASTIDPPCRATSMSAIDCAHPTQIPAIAAPARLPTGAAAPIMNAIALLAARAGVPALRYAGPY